MSENLREALDRVADGPIGPAPVAELLHRAARRRRWRTAGALAVTAATTAVVIVVAISVTGGPAASKHPQPLVSAPVVTPAQLASGTWVPIPAPPAPLCQTGSAAVLAGADVLAVNTWDQGICHGAAELYSPQTNRWRQLPAPPAAVRGYPSMAVLGDSVILIANPSHAAAALDLGTSTWHLLPSPPATLSGQTSLAANRSAVFAFGAGAQDDQVESFNGRGWTTYPDLPHLGTRVEHVVGFDADGSVWAIVTGVDPNGNLHPHVYRLTASGWTQQPQPTKLPSTVQSVLPLNSQQLIDGNICPNIRDHCALGGTSLGLTKLGTTSLTALHYPPREFMLGSAIAAGGTVVGLNDTIESGHSQVVHTGPALVYDQPSHKWLTLPKTADWVHFSYATVWTPSGLLDLGSPQRHCSCERGGLLLKPAAPSTLATGVVTGTAPLCLAIVRANQVPAKPVVVLARNGGTTAATQTVQSSGRKAGRFRFELPPGRYAIKAPDQHDAPVTVVVRAGKVQLVNLFNGCK